MRDGHRTQCEAAVLAGTYPRKLRMRRIRRRQKIMLNSCPMRTACQDYVVKHGKCVEDGVTGDITD